MSKGQNRNPKFHENRAYLEYVYIQSEVQLFWDERCLQSRLFKQYPTQHLIHSISFKLQSDSNCLET